MRATLRQKLDTTWANALEIELSVELDNPHTLTAQELAALQVHRMHLYVEEIRSENERVSMATIGSDEGREHIRDQRDRSEREQDREREAHASMERERDLARTETER